MERYTVLRDNDNIIFKDGENDIEFIVKHYPEDYHTDVVIIPKTFTEDFIEFIVKELRKSNDVIALYVKNDSKSIEARMADLGFKVSNYQYIISKDNFTREENLDYDVSDTFDVEEKTYYLDKINEAMKVNHAYLRPNSLYSPYTERMFSHDNWSYLTFRINGEIVGIVNFQDFMLDDSIHEVDDIFIVSNRVCIGGMFAKNEKVLVDIIKYLIHMYKKDIIINVTYTEKELHKAIEELKGKFMRTLYVLFE